MVREPWLTSPFRTKLRERGGDTIRCDLLARARRPWRVDLHDVAIDERRERPGQLAITRGWFTPQEREKIRAHLGLGPWGEQ